MKLWLTLCSFDKIRILLNSTSHGRFSCNRRHPKWPTKVSSFSNIIKNTSYKFLLLGLNIYNLC